MNLVNNAVESIISAPDFREKLTRSGEINGEIRIDTSNQNKKIIIRVRDNGPGISDEDLGKIFDPFFTRKKTLGMGVGLSICHGIIEDHNGVIFADSPPEGGAVFTIRLPLAETG
jgi:signal transduction histidine kinase